MQYLFLHFQISQNGNKSPTAQSWASSNWKPGPPPPPIGPSSLPPAPAVPAPPPPVIRPNQPPPPVEPIRESSFMAQRKDRDTFGVHQNRVLQNSKRNSFSANWDVQSNITQDTTDDGINWTKDGMEIEKTDGRRRDSWDLGETITNNSVEPRHLTEAWDREERKFEQIDKYIDQKPKMIKREGINDGSERPTFKTHMFSKSALEREKKHSVASTQITDKTERTEGKCDILFISYSPFFHQFLCNFIRFLKNLSNFTVSHVF